MNARQEKLKVERVERNANVSQPENGHNEIDLSLLEDSLAKTPWERMQANDDALRFAQSLRAAMKQRNATSERTDAQTR
jgi:hypothetical protein